MSDIPVWRCEFKEANESGSAKLDALTVGSKFVLSCQGDIAVKWGEGLPRVSFGEGEKAKAGQFTLQVLKVIRQDPQAADFIVTSYKAGEHAPEFFRILSGDSGFEAVNAKWKVQSVIKAEQQPPPQPYPSFGPWNLSLPVWFWALLLILLAGAAVSVFVRVRKARQRRRMLEGLKLHRTALAPIHQYYKDSRKLRNRMNQVKTAEEFGPLAQDLNKEFRLYVLREFEVPALEWSNRAILGDLSRRHRAVYRKAGEPLKKTLRELERLQSQKNLSLQDLEQMHRMSLDTAERLESAREAGK